MQAWRVEEISEAGTLVRRQIDVPVPAADQHLVKVEAAGLAFGAAVLVGAALADVPLAGSAFAVTAFAATALAAGLWAG